MSILSELKKLTGKQHAKIVSEALPDEMGASPLVVHDNDGTLDQTMGAIQTAYFRGTPIFVEHSLVVQVIPVYEGKSGFDASLSLGIIAETDGGYHNISYYVSENTALAALTAYPTIQ